MIPQGRLRAQLALRRHGPVPVVTVFLVCLGILGWALCVPRYLALQSKRLSMDAVAAVEKRPVTPTGRAVPALVPPQQLNARIRAIQSLAQAQGLTLGRVDYRWPEGEVQAHATRLQMGVPLHTDYPSLKRFVAEVLRDSPAVSLDQLTVRREDDRLDVMLWLSVWQTGLATEQAQGVAP